jgi:hypothetical protein
MRAETTDFAQKLIGLAAFVFAIELVLFKFLPDMSTAVIQHGVSGLTDFTTFEQAYLVPGSVHHARFLGNYILYDIARLLSTAYHSVDPRLHPLRVAAGLVTPLYACLGAVLVLKQDSDFLWRRFLAPYALMVLIGLYVFYPADMPSLACLSMALFFLLQEQLALALLFTLLTGLFRETSFHMVWLVGLWALCSHQIPLRNRAIWVGLFAGLFVIEYVAVRHFFPGPVSSGGGLILDPRTLFLDRGLLSLTTLCSVGLAALYPLACLERLHELQTSDWRQRFFTLNCYAFPAWLVFYRMMNGNLSEFRMLFPALLPCIYGMAWRPRSRETA